MKTKTTTKEIKKAREFKIENELKSEFGSVYGDDFLDEEAFLCNCDDDDVFIDYEDDWAVVTLLI